MKKLELKRIIMNKNSVILIAEYRSQMVVNLRADK